MSTTHRYVALLRGINVGGHHQVPMDQLNKVFSNLGFDKVVTLLNSGNVIFEATTTQGEILENTIAGHLLKVFGFSIPVLVREKEVIFELIENNPFTNIQVTKDIRLYISFLKEIPQVNIQLPWESNDGSFRICEIRDRTIVSVLDLAVTKTVKGMEALELLFGKNITTRNWNTIVGISEKMK